MKRSGNKVQRVSATGPKSKGFDGTAWPPESFSRSNQDQIRGLQLMESGVSRAFHGKIHPLSWDPEICSNSAIPKMWSMEHQFHRVLSIMSKKGFCDQIHLSLKKKRKSVHVCMWWWKLHDFQELSVYLCALLTAKRRLSEAVFKTYLLIKYFHSIAFLKISVGWNALWQTLI